MNASLFDEMEKPDVPRDRFKRPLIKPPGGGKPVGYSRASSFGDVIEDRYNLERWQQRMVAIGLSTRPDLQLAVSAHSDDKRKMDDICYQAKEAAQASSRATIGTAVHSLTERVDRGEPLPTHLPAEVRADLEAYRVATLDFQTVAMEQFVVCDGLRVAGTFDRLIRYKGSLYIADIKTGSSVEFGKIKIAVQLAVYAHGTPYDTLTASNEKVESRYPWPSVVNQDWALVLHLPSGGGACTPRWINIDKGWEAAHLSETIRDTRKDKDWYQEHTVTADPIQVAVDACRSIEDTRAAYAALIVAGHSKDVVLAACLEKNREFEVAA